MRERLRPYGLRVGIPRRREVESAFRVSPLKPSVVRREQLRQRRVNLRPRKYAALATRQVEKLGVPVSRRAVFVSLAECESLARANPGKRLNEELKTEDRFAGS